MDKILLKYLESRLLLVGFFIDSNDKVRNYKIQISHLSTHCNWKLYRSDLNLVVFLEKQDFFEPLYFEF
jgi:hypothetical protein